MKSKLSLSFPGERRLAPSAAGLLAATPPRRRHPLAALAAAGLVVAAFSPLSATADTVLVQEDFGGLNADNLAGSSADVFESVLTGAGGSATWAGSTNIKQDGYGRANNAKITYLSLGSYINDTKGTAAGRFRLNVDITPQNDGNGYNFLSFSSDAAPVAGFNTSLFGSIGIRSNADLVAHSVDPAMASLATTASTGGTRTVVVTLDLTSTYYDGSSQYGKITLSDSVLGPLAEGILTSDLSFASIAFVLDGTLTSRTATTFDNLALIQLGGVDSTPPVWQSGYPKADTQTSDGFSVRARIDEAGTAYYVVLPDGAAAPDASQVQAGNDASNNPASKSGSIPLLAFSEGAAAVTGLVYTPGISYDVYCVAQDNASIPNLQTAPVLVNWTPDLTAPTWTATYPRVDTPTENGFTVRASIVGEAGKAYYVVLDNNATAPTATQIKAGNDASNAAALKSGNIVLAADTENFAVLTELLDATDYDIYIVAEDSVLNLTAPDLREITTLPLDLDVPVWTATYPKVDTVTSLGFTVPASINEGGKAYYVVLANNATAPTAAQIKAGNDANDAAAIKSGDFTLVADTENSAAVIGLTENTDYDIYIVAEDDSIGKNTTAVVLREVATPVSALIVGSGIQYNDNVAREVSVYAGNSYVHGWLGDPGPGVEQTLSLGTVAEYNFFNGVGTSYASTGTRIGTVSANSTGSTTIAATAVYTETDPTVGPADFTGNTTMNNFTTLSGSINVTGLTSGTLYFIYGTQGTRNTSFVVTQGTSAVQLAGNSFWANTDNICAVTPVSFTNDGSNNTITYSYTQTGSGKFMGVVLSNTGGGGGSAYATWKAVNAPSGNPDDDYDGDGVSNAIEFVLGGLASTNDLGKLPTPATSGTNMTFDFNRATSSIDPGKTTVTIEVSTDLVTWTTPPSPYTVPDSATGPVNPGVTVVEDTSPGFDTVTLTVPQDVAKKFARLKVVVTP